jgi:Zn finger protein HypA/HybF involved in hydrogenase expression
MFKNPCREFLVFFLEPHRNFFMSEFETGDVIVEQSTLAPSVRDITAVLECLACGRSYSRGVGECCSARCRACVDAGEPPYRPAVVRYTTLKGAPMPIMGEGFAIKCAGCRQIFSSKGLRCCSPICEQNLRHQ